MNLNTIREKSVYGLAVDADCLYPDNDNSPGAKFLTEIRDTFVAAAAAGQELEDMCLVSASAVPVYTHDMWMTFVDLGGYREDVSEIESIDLFVLGQRALSQIGERLIGELWETMNS